MIQFRIYIFFLLFLSSSPSFADGLGKFTHCLQVLYDQSNPQTYEVIGRNGEVLREFTRTQGDHNGGFNNSGIGSSLMGEPCIQFRDWTALFQYYETKLAHLDPKDNQIFVYQAAHGSPGGDCLLNGKMVKAEEILSTLRTISKKHHVAAALKSCYSGDLMKKKVETDETVPSSELRNLCIATSSVPGQMSFSDGFNLNLNKIFNKNMVQFFSDQKDGLLSAAPFRFEADYYSPEIKRLSVASSSRCNFSVEYPRSPLGQTGPSIRTILESLSQKFEGERDNANRAACEEFKFTLSPNSIQNARFAYERRLLRSSEGDQVLGGMLKRLKSEPIDDVLLRNLINNTRWPRDGLALYRDEERKTDLELALELDRTDLIERMLDRGFELEWLTSNGHSHFQLLVDRIKRVDYESESDLKTSAKIMEILAKSSRRYRLKDSDGNNLSHVIANLEDSGKATLGSEFNYRKSRALLDMYEFVLNEPNNRGETAIEIVVRKGHADLVNLLLKRGISPTQSTSTGITLRELALKFGHNDIAEKLDEAEKKLNSGSEP